MSDLLITQADNPNQSSGYTVLARRYRSRSFEEIVGQETISRTLQNAISRNRIAHAYLFCGTRGVGKTSMARIFAKTLNATEDLSEYEAIATAILKGEDIDVIEIDAASNTGVDNVRDLIANAGLMPARCQYKIYIIDEVHMLSKAAFNALLKTMEEPPSHVKFVLCTTEPQKVPATIQSRCQRFDFRNISAVEIANHLNNVLDGEKIESEQSVVNEVARLANGSMRDGLSLLDRLIAAGEGKLTEEALQNTLGTPDHALVAGVVDGFTTGDPAKALQAAGELLSSGTSIDQAISVLVEHIRNVMIITSCGSDSTLIEVFGEARDAAEKHADQFDTAGLVHMIALCEATTRNIVFSSTPRALFDALIARLAIAEHLASIPALLKGSGATIKTNTQKKSPARVTEVKQVLHRQVETVNRPSKPVNPLPGAQKPLPPPPVRKQPSKAELEAARNIPAVNKAIEILGATLIDIREETKTDQQDSNDV